MLDIILIQWIKFWKKKPIFFYTFLLLIFLVLGFYASRLTISQNINDVFEDTQLNSLVNQSNEKKLFFLIELKNNNSNEEEIYFSFIEDLKNIFNDNININQNTFFNEKIIDTLIHNIPFYLNKEDYETIEGKLNNLPNILSNNHKRLYSLNNMLDDKIIFKDPLGLIELIQDKINVSNYLKESNKNQGLFIITDINANSLTEKTIIYDKLLEQQKHWKEKEVKINFFSTSFIAVENAKRIKKDLRITLSITLIAIFSLLLFFFHKINISLYFLLAPSFGMLFSLSIINLFKGEISGIALGMGAVVFGIIIDYSFHFFSHLKNKINSYDAIKEIAKPLIYSASTTIIAFLALTFTHSKILNDFGWFASISLTGALIFILFILPVIISDSFLKKGNYREIKISVFNNKVITLCVTLLTIFLLFQVNEISFDSNINNLNYYPKPLKDAEEKVLSTNYEFEKKIYLSIKGDQEEEVKEKNLFLFELLENLKKENQIINYSNFSQYDLPKSLIREKKNKWIEFWASKKEETIKALSLTQQKFNYHVDAFKEFEKQINDKNPVFFPIKRKNFESFLTYKTNNTWATNNVLSVNVLNKEDVISKLKNNDIEVFEISNIASNLLEEVKSDFNYLISFGCILVFCTLLLIYGRLEIALVTFIPMLIGGIWVLGFCSIFNIQFNFVNIIIATLIFGLGDDFVIFISDGYLKKYATNKKIIQTHMNSILLSASTTLIALGSLFFAKHPAIHSLASVSIVGIVSIVIIAFYIQPLLYKWLIFNREKKNLPPLTIVTILSTFISFFIFVIGSLLLTTFMLFIDLFPFNKRRIKIFSHRLLQIGASLPIWASLTVQQRGYNKKLLNFSKPSILIANHQSFIDILQMLMLNPKIIFVVKDWVYYSPIFGKLARILGYVTVSNGVDKNIDDLQKLIKDGYSIMVFPEGTRSKSEKIQRFHKGAFYMSEKLKLDILPILLHGYGNAIRKKDFIINKSIISYKVLPRICWDDKSWGNGYRERAKKIKVYFKKELEIFSFQQKNTKYIYGNILSNIIYKGPILEWYFKIKWKLERKEYEKINTSISNDAKIYDLGCGYGFLTSFLKMAAEKREVIGVDYDRKKIQHAKNYLSSKLISFLNQEIENIKIQDADAIILYDVLHYLSIDEQISILENCIQGLNKNGQIIIRDGLRDKKNKTKMTKLTEWFATKVFYFNKTTKPFNFLSIDMLNDFAKKHNLTLNYKDSYKYTSNNLFILK